MIGIRVARSKDLLISDSFMPLVNTSLVTFTCLWFKVIAATFVPTHGPAAPCRARHFPGSAER